MKFFKWTKNIQKKLKFEEYQLILKNKKNGIIQKKSKNFNKRKNLKNFKINQKFHGFWKILRKKIKIFDNTKIVLKKFEKRIWNFSAKNFENLQQNQISTFLKNVKKIKNWKISI